MSDILLVEERGAVDWVTLNRPDALNALNGEMVETLASYFEGLYRRHDRRVVVLQAAGKAFCAGLDLKESVVDAEAIKRAPVQTGMAGQRRIGDIYRAMRRCQQPIISLVHGAACGGGFSLALASDIRIVADKARMNCAFVRIGYTGADMGSSYFLPRLVGLGMASELMLTGRFVEAEEALRIGLANHVTSQDGMAGKAEELIQYMLTTSPMGLRLTKEALSYSVDAPGMDAAVAMEDRHQILMGQTKDQREATQAFLEKRTPDFKDH